METVTVVEAAKDLVMELAGPTGLAMESQKKNRIQVSNTKKPLFFYVNLAKRYMQQHNEVELSALGMGYNNTLSHMIEQGYKGPSDNVLNSIATVVTISEILKRNGLAIEKKILTSTVDMKDETKGRMVQKAKIEILLGKTENFDNLMTAATAEYEVVGVDNTD